MTEEELTDEAIMDIYERYCLENRFYDEILYPTWTMEDHFGNFVKEFLEKNTDYLEKYSYYTLDDDNNVCWYTEEAALEKAKERIKII